MEETFNWSKKKNTLKKALHANFWRCNDTLILLVLQKVKRKICYRKIIEESFPSLSVTKNRVIHVQKSKALYPPTQ